MLKSETNTPEIQAEILESAKICFNHYSIEDNKIYVIFEHGQWWVRFLDEAEEIERTFSVFDAEHYETFNDFDFEEV